MIDVIVVTKNAASNLDLCLTALKGLGTIYVVDSNSSDDTKTIALQHNVVFHSFTWNGYYPKKRQWCLEHLKFKSDWVFFIDSDEIITKELITEIKETFKSETKCAGYFVHGRYLMNGRTLRFGLKNSKLCLFHRHSFEFPIIDDLSCPAMGEIEGHYQPVLKPEYAHKKIGALKQYLLHNAYNDTWNERHHRYTQWEVFMDYNALWPNEPTHVRSLLKTIFRASCLRLFRPMIAFLHSYIIKLGMLDGHDGLQLAASRYRYYAMINAAAKKRN